MINRREFLIRGTLAGAGALAAFKNTQAQNLTVLGANDRIRVGVIGLNTRGCRNLEGFTAVPNVEIAAVCDPDPTKLRQAFEHYSKETSRKPLLTKDPRRLFDLPEIDAICFSSPLPLRFETATAALACGKNVFSEGPITRSISEAKRLILAAAKGKCLIGQNEDESFQLSRSFTVGNGILNEDFKRVSGLASFRCDPMQIPLSNRQKAIEQKSHAVYLPDDIYGFLDISRNIMNVGMPIKISTIDSGLGRKAIYAEFPSERSDRKQMTLELVPASRLANTVEAQLGHLTFFSGNGSLEMEAVEYAGRSVNNSCFSNFVSCLRNNNPEGLQNPFSEVRKSIAILQLAELSFGFRRSINFDVKKELAIDDEEINRLL